MDHTNLQWGVDEESNVGLIDMIDVASLLYPTEVEHNQAVVEYGVTDMDGDLEDTGHTMVHIEDQNINLPHVGKKFSSEEEAYNYYNALARSQGFSIRRSVLKKKNDVHVWRMFICSKEGFKDENDKRVGAGAKRRRVDRVGCMARMTVSKIKDGFWEVKYIDNEHNHDLLSTPSKVARLRSHNKAHLNPKFKALVEQFREAGIRPSQMARALTVTGATSSATVIPQQCIDIRREKRKSNIGREFQSIIKYFMKKKDEDCHFYFAMEIDEDNTCRSIFWADGRARTSNLKFSDVVVFDVTYKTNNFLLPFAHFTGVNHHRQSSLFGCALLADEREETFVWLFETWLHCMWGKMPGTIITDQDTAIRNAIRRVLPNTLHRYCIWHIGLHEPEQLRSLQHAYPTFDDDYRKWAYFSLNVNEAEARWVTLTDKYMKVFDEPLTESQKKQLKSWKWLQNMYDQRYHWVEAYLKDRFFAGMKSSQRSESINAFFDNYVNSMTSLSEFVHKYEQALVDRRTKEEREDTLCLRTTIDTRFMHALEIFASKVYTRNVFRIFQEEFRYVIHCQKERVRTEGFIKTYKVMVLIVGRISNHLVQCNLVEQICTCTCARFETGGILCKHILYIMWSKLKLQMIPDRYVLPRWTLNARYSTTSEHGNSRGSFVEKTIREGQVTPLEAWSFQASWMDCVEKSLRDREMYDFAKGLLDSFWKKCSTDLPSNITIQDPQIRIRKGRPKIATRIPSGIHVSKGKKTRTCSKCSQQGHDARTCPQSKSNEPNEVDVGVASTFGPENRN